MYVCAGLAKHAEYIIVQYGGLLLHVPWLLYCRCRPLSGQTQTLPVLIPGRAWCSLLWWPPFDRGPCWVCWMVGEEGPCVWGAREGREGKKERRRGEIRVRDKESSWLNGANIVIDNDSGSWCLQYLHAIIPTQYSKTATRILHAG